MRGPDTSKDSCPEQGPPGSRQRERDRRKGRPHRQRPFAGSACRLQRRRAQSRPLFELVLLLFVGNGFGRFGRGANVRRPPGTPPAEQASGGDRTRRCTDEVLAIPQVKPGGVFDPGEQTHDPLEAQQPAATEDEYIGTRAHALEASGKSQLADGCT